MPTTEAGQALLHAVIDPRLDEPILRSVDAIEAEARAEGYAAGLAAAREAVAGLDLPLGNDLHVSRARSEVIRDFAAAIDALAVDPTKCETCGRLADGEPGRCHRHFRHNDPPSNLPS